MTGPYGRSAGPYLKLGYSPLPLPPRQKWPPPKGWTGAGAPMADLEQVRRWERSDSSGNIALASAGGRDRHRPRPLRGPDEGSPGRRAAGRLATSWSAASARCRNPRGPPAATTASSGIRLYRVPAGWKGAGILPAAPVCEGHPLPDGREARPGNPVSPGEVIQHHHRYMVAPPSVHPSGRPYRWHRRKPACRKGPSLPGAAMNWLDALSESKPISRPVPAGNGPICPPARRGTKAGPVTTSTSPPTGLTSLSHSARCSITRHPTGNGTGPGRARTGGTDTRRPPGMRTTPTG